jgi:hypothetical protein
MARRAVDHRAHLRDVSRACRPALLDGQSPVRRRAADAGGGPGADDQSAPALLDEATEGLAPLIRQKIWAALARIRTTACRSWSWTRTSPTSSASPTGTVIIEKGRVVWQGTSPELAAQQDIQHRYLGV